MLTENVIEDARMTPWQRSNLRVQQRRVAMAEHEYETVWNGTMERNGPTRGVPHDPSSAQLNMDLPDGRAGADNKNERVGNQKVAV